MYEKGKRDATGETALEAESVQKKRLVPKEVSKKKFYDGDYAYRSTIFDCYDDEWNVDSGATQRMTDQRSVFDSFKTIPPGTRAIKGIKETTSQYLRQALETLESEQELTVSGMTVLFKMLYLPKSRRQSLLSVSSH